MKVRDKAQLTIALLATASCCNRLYINIDSTLVVVCCGYKLKVTCDLF